jgi:hypothetical protein
MQSHPHRFSKKREDIFRDLEKERVVEKRMRKMELWLDKKKGEGKEQRKKRRRKRGEKGREDKERKKGGLEKKGKKRG